MFDGSIARASGGRGGLDEQKWRRKRGENENESENESHWSPQLKRNKAKEYILHKYF